MWHTCFMHGLTIAARSLRRAPVFTAVAVVSLALAIGANSAIFSLIDAVLLRPLPGIGQPQRIVSLYSSLREQNLLTGTSWTDYLYYRDRNRVFSGVMAYVRFTFPVAAGGLTENLPGELASDNYFGVLGVVPRLGRGFAAGESGDVVIVGDRYWRQRLNADSKIIGRTMTIGNHPFEIIGVAPRGFHGVLLDWGERPQFWIPLLAYRDASPVLAGWSDVLRREDARMFMLNARLKNGIGLAQAAAEIGVLQSNIDAGDPARAARRTRQHWSMSVLPLTRFYPAFRRQIVRMLGVLIAVVFGVLIVACTNLASLMLIRASQRRKETAVRIALGARAGDLARLLLSESLWIAAAGCAGGLLVAIACTRALASFPRLSVIPLASLDLAVDWRVCAFAASITVISIVALALVPLRQSMKADLTGALKSRGGAGRIGSRGFLLVTQIGVTLTLLAGASLFIQTFQNAARTDRFLHAGNLLLANVETNAASGSGAFFEQLLEQTQALPGVQAAGAVWVLPLSGMRTDSEVAILRGPDARQAVNIRMNVVSPRYFETIGAGMAAGRDFRWSDREGAAIVNEAMAEQFWPGGAIGQQMTRRNKTVTIVGVVHDPSRRQYRQAVLPCLYLPVTEEDREQMKLVVRVSGASLAAFPAIRSIAASLSRNAVVDHVQTLGMYENEALATERMAAWCLSALAGLALVLSMVGLYGAMAFSVSRRTAEIGVRMALGARPGDVMRMVLASAARIAACGMVIGAVASIMLVRYANSMLYGVTGADPWTWSIAGALLNVLHCGCERGSRAPRRACRSIDGP
ncbi:MAG: ABC transporter permease [Bryobacteraceae bacterium]